MSRPFTFRPWSASAPSTDSVRNLTERMLGILEINVVLRMLGETSAGSWFDVSDRTVERFKSA